MAVAKPRTLSGGPEVMGDLRARRHRLPALSRVDGWLLGAIGVLALAALSLALRSDATVFLKPFSEDGYYSLAVARSMAQRGDDVLGLVVLQPEGVRHFVPVRAHEQRIRHLVLIRERPNVVRRIVD